MKKFSYLLLTVLVTLGLSGCFGSKRDVAKFSMTMSDQEGTVVLSFVPDYDKRTLAVDYKKDNVDKKQQSLATVGQIGGENFDKFEDLVKVVRKYKMKDGVIVDENKPNFVVTVEGKDQTNVGIKTGIEDPDKEVEKLMDFYYDIVELLTGSTHV